VLVRHECIKAYVEVYKCRCNQFNCRYFSEVDKCDPNPCYNNASCVNDRIRFKCICPNSTEPGVAFVGLLCNKSKLLRRTFTTILVINMEIFYM